MPGINNNPQYLHTNASSATLASGELLKAENFANFTADSAAL